MSSNRDREIFCVNNLLNQTGVQSSLTDVQELVLRHCCLGHSYQEIASNSNYEYGYIKKVGSQLWQLLSKCLGKKVSKSNVRSLLQYQLRQDIYLITSHYLNSKPNNLADLSNGLKKNGYSDGNQSYGSYFN